RPSRPLPPCTLYSLLSLAAPPTTAIYTLSLHDALPIFERQAGPAVAARDVAHRVAGHPPAAVGAGAFQPLKLGHGVGQPHQDQVDRKSTRLNSSHVKISYAVFCLKKKNKKSKTHEHK